MLFFFRSLKLAITSIPYLFASKILFEVKLQMFMACIGIVFIAVAIVATPLAIVVLPLLAAGTQSAISIGTLHSMFAFLGGDKKYQPDYLLSEVLKMSIVRTGGLIIVLSIVCLVMLLTYDIEYLLLSLENKDKFVELELSRLEVNGWPALLVLAIVFGLLTIILEAVLAVPMAAAAYGITPGNRSFNGFWGIGYSWSKILTAWISFGVGMAMLWWLVIANFTTGFDLSMLIHALISELSGTNFTTDPDLAETGEFTHKFGPYFMALLALATCLIPVPLWAACGVLAFKDKLAAQPGASRGSIRRHLAI